MVDNAVTATVLPAGTSMGAVNVVGTPLAVWEGEKEPQLGALLHIAAQSTPAFARSLLTVADTDAVSPTDNEEGGRRIRDTDIVGVDDAAPVCEPPKQPETMIEAARRRRSGRRPPH